MRQLIAIVAAVLVGGFALLLIRQNTQNAHNRDAIQNTISSAGGAGRSTSPAMDARQRERVLQSPAGARHRQLQR